MLAVRLLQFKFGYKLTKLKASDNLLRPVSIGCIKLVTLMSNYDDYKHVISIVADSIFDSTNRKVLSLCEENIAWCSSRSVEDLKEKSRKIDCGYFLKPPKKLKRLILNRINSSNGKQGNPQNNDGNVKRRKVIRNKRDYNEL